MGGGHYDSNRRSIRAMHSGYNTRSANELFARHMQPELDPNGLIVRESRDSEEHPESYPIIIALDVTGSMTSIPETLLRETFPKIMTKILESGVAHPQVCFLAIGDHEYDTSPLQVSQFESSDELLDKWLTKIFIEGGGGGNGGESYLLTWLIASRFTQTDSFDKRLRKGVLITIGDEPGLSKISARYLNKIFGPERFNTTLLDKELLDEASEKWHCYHINVMEGSNGTHPETKRYWDKLMLEKVYHIDSFMDVDKQIASLVIKAYENEMIDPNN